MADEVVERAVQGLRDGHEGGQARVVVGVVLDPEHVPHGDAAACEFRDGEAALGSQFPEACDCHAVMVPYLAPPVKSGRGGMLVSLMAGGASCDTHRVTYGELLRAWLTHLDVSANELGRRLGAKDGRAVRKWFRAPRGPFMDTQKRVAAALGLTLQEFMEGPPSSSRAAAGDDASRLMRDVAGGASRRPPATGELPASGPQP